PARGDRHLAVGDHRLLVGRADEAEVDGKGDDGDPEAEDQVCEEIAEAPPLNHAPGPSQLQVCGLRKRAAMPSRHAAISLAPLFAVARRASPITPEGVMSRNER